MKKICILSTVNIKHMTMISIYTDYLEKHNIKYDIIYVDKYDEKEQIGAQNIYCYKIHVEREWNVIKKIFKYYKFKKYAQKKLNENKYDFIIVWNSFTGLMFSNFLSFKYKNKYSLNIRDYAYEKNKYIYFLMKIIIKKASFVTISSDGFKSFLPEHKYISIHSLNKNILKQCTPRNKLRSIEEPISITFMGYVRFFENDKKLIDQLGNDSRFIVQFFGEGSHILDKYVEKKKYKNIICKGRFDPSETKNFINNTDIINNLYGVGQVELDTALSIKLYYAAYMNIPILVFNNTYMKDVSTRYGFGINIDIDSYEGLGDKIYNWYRTTDFEKIRSGCQKFIKDIEIQNSYFYKVIDNKILDIKEIECYE